MSVRTKALKAAFPHTVPVLTGFLFLGIAYGIIMDSKGYGAGWSFLMSLFVYAGSAQYVAVTFLTSAFNPLYALLLTIMVNARHIFYGISMLRKYEDMGRFKPYLIFGLTDETFSIVCSQEPPPGVDRRWFAFFITLLDHIYWVSGSVIGGLVGSLVRFDTRGLDFALTALFVVIFIDQWRSRKSHAPAIIGVSCSLASLVVFGPGNFILPAMAAIIVVLSLLRQHELHRKAVRL